MYCPTSYYLNQICVNRGFFQCLLNAEQLSHRSFEKSISLTAEKSSIPCFGGGFEFEWPIRGAKCDLVDGEHSQGDEGRLCGGGGGAQIHRRRRS